MVDEQHLLHQTLTVTSPVQNMIYKHKKHNCRKIAGLHNCRKIAGLDMEIPPPPI